MSSLVFITNTAGTAGRAPWPRSSSRLCVPAVLGRPEHLSQIGYPGEEKGLKEGAPCATQSRSRWLQPS